MAKTLKSPIGLENIVYRGEWIYDRFKDIRAYQE